MNHSLSRRGIFLCVIFFAFFLSTVAWGQSTDYYIPQVVDGGGFKTLFSVTNLSASSIAQFTIQVTLNSGSPGVILNIPGQTGAQSGGTVTIQPGGQVTITTFSGSSLSVGWAKISSSNTVGVSATFLFLPGGTVTSAAGILPQPAQNTFTLLGLITAAAKTGVAVLNPSASSTANVSFQLFDGSGAQVSTTKTIQVSPLSKIAQFFDEGQLFAGTTNFTGSVAISSDVPIQVLTLRVDFPSGALSTLPNMAGRTGVPLQHADATFNFIDATAAAGGSRVVLAGDPTTGDVNGQSAGMSLPFNVTLYGTTYGNSLFDQMFISEDGWISFVSGAASTPHPLPSASDPPSLVAPLFVDLHFNANTSSVGVFTKTVGTAPNRQFVVEWVNVSFVNSALGQTTFEVVFFEGTSDIKFQYQTLTSNTSGLASAGLVVGIQDATRTQATAVNVSTTPPQNGKVFTFQYFGGSSYTLIHN
jgi:hypothetical protein